MSRALWKQPQFLLGSFILLSLMAASIAYPFFFELPEEVNYLYEDGKLVGVPPFSPAEAPPFGTDVFGRNLLDLMINGAKYTLLFALGIALVRVLLAGVLSFFYYHYNEKLRPLLEDLIESMLYIPTAIVAYLFLAPLATKYSEEGGGFVQMVLTQCIILALLGVPPLLAAFSKDIARISNQEYIVSTLSLGAKHRYVYFKHVLPEMGSRFLLVVAQQIIQVLILLSHLGVLYIFIGGAATIIDGDLLSEHEVFVSLTGEWAGLIGNNYDAINHSPHLILIPLGFFSLAIFAMNMVINGMRNAMQRKERREVDEAA
ncbi:ABC transporter permease subunit [Thalassobacillus hwangdonensis]|uniref:ABC transporter permease subunit n=1 Tax=Thalassobacillus hwangdonensis TaxID=546108 RepID=A0ABW3L556_9BACI